MGACMASKSSLVASSEHDDAVSTVSTDVSRDRSPMPSKPAQMSRDVESSATGGPRGSTRGTIHKNPVAACPTRVQNFASQLPSACAQKSKVANRRNSAELELAELMKRWFVAYLQSWGKEKRVSGVVTGLLRTMAPGLLPLTCPDDLSVEAAITAINSWACGAGHSLGPQSQVEKMRNTIRTEVRRVEGVLAIERRAQTARVELRTSWSLELHNPGTPAAEIN